MKVVRRHINRIIDGLPVAFAFFGVVAAIVLGFALIALLLMVVPYVVMLIVFGIFCLFFVAWVAGGEIE